MLVRTKVAGAKFTRCRVYGVSAWDLDLKNVKNQSNLRITRKDQPERITVDNLEVAQFVYLLLHNDKIRDVINTWGLLARNFTNDSRRTAGTHYDWDTRLLATGPAPTTNERCVDMMHPYDFVQSQQNSLSPTDDECTKHGFVFRSAVVSYRGTPGGTANPIQSTQTVQTSSTVEAMDDFGRITRARNDNDRVRLDDNVCVEMTYATPTGTNERVLNAPASRTVTDCGLSPQTLAYESWEYDGKRPTASDPAIRVSNGFVTAHIVSRLDMDTHASLGDIRDFDATYDVVGNPLTVTKTRDDGATQTITTTYDAFGLAPLTVKTDATNADGTKPLSQQTTFIRDPVTLRTTVASDPNGMKLGYKYNGFDRLTQTSVTPPTGPGRVLSTTSYNGFAISATTARNIVQKVFTDPVAPANLGTLSVVLRRLTSTVSAARRAPKCSSGRTTRTRS